MYDTLLYIVHQLLLVVCVCLYDEDTTVTVCAVHERCSVDRQSCRVMSCDVVTKNTCNYSTVFDFEHDCRCDSMYRRQIMLIMTVLCRTGHDNTQRTVSYRTCSLSSVALCCNDWIAIAIAMAEMRCAIDCIAFFCLLYLQCTASLARDS
jgi:hypothetical protein